MTENKTESATKTVLSLALSEKQRRELWLYIAVSIVGVELMIAVGAVFYSFISAVPNAAGVVVIVFPWLPWGVLSAVAPSLLLLLAHFADVGLFRAPGGAYSEQEWQKLLPKRMQSIYRIIKGAPVVAVLIAIILLGAALLTIDGAIAAMQSLGSVLLPYLPHIMGGIVGVVVIAIIAVVWLNYRTRRLIAEYEFRREVLQKTGVIIVDKGSAALPPGGEGDVPYAIISAENPENLALPEGDKNEK